MAKVVRKNKVSKKATAGQKRRGNIFHNKWFWIIGSIALVVIASAIIIPVVIHINKTKSDDDTDVVDYFRTSEEVNFTFQTYNGLKNYITPDYVGVEGESLFKEKVIIFAYDKTQFYPNQAYEKDDDDSTIYNAEHKALLERIVNLQKVVDAAVRQVKAIRIIDREIGIDALPDKLRIVARLRWDNPEASLKELEELMDGELSKSGIGHRLKKIEALALTYDPMGLEEI